MNQIQTLKNKYTPDRLRLTDEPEYRADLLKVYDILVEIKGHRGHSGDRNGELFTAIELLERIADFHLERNSAPSKELSELYALCRDEVREAVCSHCGVHPSDYSQAVIEKTLLEALEDAGMIQPRHYPGSRWGSNRTDAKKREAAAMAAEKWQEVARLYHQVASTGLTTRDPVAAGGDGYRLYEKWLNLPATLYLVDPQDQIEREALP